MTRPTTVNKKIEHLNNTLALKIDISSAKILSLYEEAEIHFKDSLKKSIEEVTNFHEQMLDQRQKKAGKDLAKAKIQKEEKTIILETLKKEINDYAEVFKNTGTFEEYDVLSNEISKKKIELGKIKELDEMLGEIESKTNKLKVKLQSDEIKSDDYLKNEKEFIENLIAIFHNLAKKFYDNTVSGIEITNNKGDNKLRFNIDAYIPRDSSDGINEVKIFCFDIMLMILKNHKNNFLIHDSRLLSDIDSRQQITLFNVANEVFTGIKKQYIISINENTLVGMKDNLTWGTVSHLFEGENKKIILELTDENETSMLLGKELGLKYD